MVRIVVMTIIVWQIDLLLLLQYHWFSIKTLSLSNCSRSIELCHNMCFALLGVLCFAWLCLMGQFYRGLKASALPRGFHPRSSSPSKCKTLGCMTFFGSQWESRDQNLPSPSAKLGLSWGWGWQAGRSPNSHCWEVQGWKKAPQGTKVAARETNLLSRFWPKADGIDNIQKIILGTMRWRNFAGQMTETCELRAEWKSTM